MFYNHSHVLIGEFQELRQVRNYVVYCFSSRITFRANK